MRIARFGIFGIAALLAACTAWSATPQGPYLRSEFSGGNLSNVIYVFDGDRVAYAAGGRLSPFDFDAHAAQTPKNAGQYTTSGDTLTIQWGDGSKQEGQIRWDAGGGGFQFYGAPFAPIRPVRDPSRLAGRYYGGASYGGVSSAFDLVFDGAGGYRSSSTGSISSSSAGSDVSALSARDGGGRYRLDGDRLDLGDGVVHWLYEVDTGNADHAEMLVLDGAVLTRDDD
jgi:hypothetical protein